MAENSPEIVFGDCVKNARTVAPFDDPNCGLGGVCECNIHPPHARDVGQILSRKRLVPLAACEDDILRIAATPFILYRPRRFGFDIGAQIRIFQARQNLFASAFLCPGRKQCRPNVGTRSRVWILIDRRVDTTLARFIDKLKRHGALAPVPCSNDFVMRHLRGKTAALTDRDRLLDTIGDFGCLVAHV